MSESDDIARFIATRGVTRCPPAALNATTATISSADRDALRMRARTDMLTVQEARNARASAKVEKDPAKKAEILAMVERLFDAPRRAGTAAWRRKGQLAQAKARESKRLAVGDDLPPPATLLAPVEPPQAVPTHRVDLVASIEAIHSVPPPIDDVVIILAVVLSSFEDPIEDIATPAGPKFTSIADAHDDRFDRAFRSPVVPFDVPMARETAEQIEQSARYERILAEFQFMQDVAFETAAETARQLATPPKGSLRDMSDLDLTELAHDIMTTLRERARKANPRQPQNRVRPKRYHKALWGQGWRG